MMIIKYAACAFVLDVVLVYYLRPEHPLYVLAASILLALIARDDASGKNIDKRLVYFLVFVGLLIREHTLLLYVVLCAIPVLMYALFRRIPSVRKVRQEPIPVFYELIGIAAVLSYHLLVLPMPDAVYNMIFLPFAELDQTLLIMFAAAVAGNIALREYDAPKERIFFYAALFGLCHPLIILLSMWFGRILFRMHNLDPHSA
ncbi:MAG: hypothetical protein ACFN1I_00850 [Selenomonas artemidis]